LTVLSGIAWTIVYIDSIRVGFKQKTYAMPITATAVFTVSGMACSLAQCPSPAYWLTRQEHGRTIPLA
jgi:hypothetical protein